MSTGTSAADPRPTNWGGIWFLGLYMVGLFLLLVYLVVVLWPTKIPPGQAEQPSHVREVILLFGPLGGRIYATSEMRLIILVMLAGSLGSFLHALTSFADFVGNRRFISSWMWWYVLRPFVGAALALIVYFAVRAGFMSVTTQSNDINIYGIVAIAALAGLFSKQATDKLDEVFTTLFRTEHGEGDDKRKDRLEKVPRPVAASLAPAQVEAGASTVEVNVVGTDFVRGSIVLYEGQDRETTFIGATKLSASLRAEDVATAGTYEIQVYSPGGGLSKPLPLTVSPRATAAKPILTALEPTQVVAGSGPQTVRLRGSGFSNGTVVRWGEKERQPQDVSPSALSVALTAEETANPGDVNVSIVGPPPDRSKSDTQVFRITKT